MPGSGAQLNDLTSDDALATPTSAPHGTARRRCALNSQNAKPDALVEYWKKRSASGSSRKFTASTTPLETSAHVTLSACSVLAMDSRSSTAAISPAPLWLHLTVGWLTT
eukprot:334439-Chlamydomonas_euryale.AAC.1